MSTTVTQRIAGILHLGRMRADVQARLQAEGEILYLAEGIAATARFFSFRAPGVRIYERVQGFVGYLALTERRMVASAGMYNRIRLSVAFNDPQFQQIEFIARPKYLAVSYDPSIQSPEMSGKIEIRFHLPDVAAAATILAEKGARLKAEAIEIPATE